MRTALTPALLALSLPAVLVAQERTNSTAYQYLPDGLGGRAAAVTEVELALDVAGGRDKCYLYGPPDPTNGNHLWSLRPVGECVMFVSRVDGLALDANGGTGNPYPRAADPTNVNHLWILAQVGDHYMIWSKVTNAVLDANGGRGRPYLSTNPDPRNVNHLWSLRKVGDYVMIIPKVRRPVVAAGGAPRWEVGQPAPAVPALGPDGSPLLLEPLRGKTVLLTFWSLTGAGGRRHLELLRGLRQEFLHAERFQMVSVCLGGEDGWDDWLWLLDRQRPFDDRHPLHPFASDARWWQVFHRPSAGDGGDPCPAGEPPQSFLIGPDGRLLAAHVPDEKLREVVARALSPSGR
jgi:hypothetical protein